MIIEINIKQGLVKRYDGQELKSENVYVDSNEFMQWFGGYVSNMTPSQSNALDATHILIAAMPFLYD